MTGLVIRYQSPSALTPNPCNPRTHSKKQIRQIADSIRQFGFVSAVLVDGDNQIIAGHGRVEGAKLAGLDQIPTVRVDHMSENEIRGYIIADNKLALKAGWDDELLKTGLLELSDCLEFKVTLTGFEPAELDLIFRNEPKESRDDIPSANFSKPAVSRMGDLWRVGPHAVLCADSTQSESYQRLLNNELAQLVFTDPPYNVPIKGHVSGLGKNKHNEFAMASGEMDRAQFTAFLRSVFENLCRHSADGSIHYICMDWRHMRELLDGAEGFYELENLCVWNKTNGGMGSFYRSQHELVFVLQNGSGSHINNVELGKHGRNRTNVWTYPGVNTFGANRDVELAMHPTVKPVALVTDAILDASERGGVVLDAFGGSGTTLVAAADTGRRGFALEISPHYVDTIVRRLSTHLKTDAVLDGSRETFESVSRWRSSGLNEEEVSVM